MASPQLTRRLLSSALTLWLRSQVEGVEQLQVAIKGSDRQIWSGHVPGVSLQATDVVYRGLAFSTVSLSAGQLRVNLPQVLRGQSLRLLEVVPVQVQVALSASDLGRSLQSALGRQALGDLFRLILAAPQGRSQFPTLPQEALASLQVHQPQVQLGGDRLTVAGLLHLGRTAIAGEASSPIWQTPVWLSTQLTVGEGHRLCLTQCQITTGEAAGIGNTANPTVLNQLVLDLGPDVAIQSLEVSTDGLICRGQIKVYSPSD